MHFFEFKVIHVDDLSFKRQKCIINLTLKWHIGLWINYLNKCNLMLLLHKLHIYL